MKKLSLGALVAAGLLMGGLTAGSASAADLGGNCCADLEERIAELEATTARKGNRKVSLTISGWVAEQVMWWDDGAERNTYVGGLGTTLASHVNFTGQATIMPGWYAGYVLQLEMIEHDPLGQWPGSDQAPGSRLLRSAGVNYAAVFYSYWFVKSDHLGKVSVGLAVSARDNTAILVDGSGSLVPANWVLFDNGFGTLRTNNGGAFGATLGSSTSAEAGAGSAATATACRRTWSVTTRQRLLASPCRPPGVKTICGTSPRGTRVSGTASSLLPPMPITKSLTATTTTSARLLVLRGRRDCWRTWCKWHLQQGWRRLHAVRVEGEIRQIGAYVEHVPTGLFAYVPSFLSRTSSSLRNKANGALTNLTWNDIGSCNIGHGVAGDCVGTPENLVRYDSPTFAGFSVSADWGQDTYWDVYARYAGEYNGIKIAAVSGWSETNRCTGNNPTPGFCPNSVLNTPGVGNAIFLGDPAGGGASFPFLTTNGTNKGTGDVGYWQSGVYIEHVATGLFVLGNYGREFLSDGPTATATSQNCILGLGLLGGAPCILGFTHSDTVKVDSQPDHWYVKAGLREQWTSLGHTVLYGEYAERHNMIDNFTEPTDAHGLQLLHGGRSDERPGTALQCLQRHRQWS